MSVYGSSPGRGPLTEDGPTVPDQPYGVAKRAVETDRREPCQRAAIEFLSLRIARVVGPGIKKTSCPWRCQILVPLPLLNAIHIPFSAKARLWSVHVENVARMLVTLAGTAEMFSKSGGNNTNAPTHWLGPTHDALYIL
jgi:nucleoside-diphosphate-sugar epimerase